MRFFALKAFHDFRFFVGLHLAVQESHFEIGKDFFLKAFEMLET